MYPNRLILAVTTHGMLKCETENRLRKFKMPTGIKMVKLSVSTFGEVNVMDTWQADDAIEIISACKRKLLSNKTPLNNIIAEIAFHLRNADETESNGFLYKHNKDLTKIIDTYNWMI